MVQTYLAALLAAALLLAAPASAQTTSQILAVRTPFRSPPWTIAHRGDAGELPEETLEAYRQGIAEVSVGVRGSKWGVSEVSETPGLPQRREHSLAEQHTRRTANPLQVST